MSFMNPARADEDCLSAPQNEIDNPMSTLHKEEDHVHKKGLVTFDLNLFPHAMELEGTGPPIGPLDILTQTNPYKEKKHSPSRRGHSTLGSASCLNLRRP